MKGGYPAQRRRRARPPREPCTSTSVFQEHQRFDRQDEIVALAPIVQQFPPLTSVATGPHRTAVFHWPKEKIGEVISRHTNVTRASKARATNRRHHRLGEI